MQLQKKHIFVDHCLCHISIPLFQDFSCHKCIKVLWLCVVFGPYFIVRDMPNLDWLLRIFQAKYECFWAPFGLTYEKPKAFFKSSIRALMSIWLILFKEFMTYKRAQDGRHTNITSWRNFILAHASSSFIFNKTFTIEILSFKIYDFGLSFNFQLRQKTGWYPKRALSNVWEVMIIVLWILKQFKIKERIR